MTQAALFYDLPAAAEPPPARIAGMYRVHGIIADKRCKTCTHLVFRQPGRTRYYKCDLAQLSWGPGTDWRTGYTACGRWEPETH